MFHNKNVKKKKKRGNCFSWRTTWSLEWNCWGSRVKWNSLRENVSPCSISVASVSIKERKKKLFQLVIYSHLITSSNSNLHHNDNDGVHTLKSKMDSGCQMFDGIGHLTGRHIHDAATTKSASSSFSLTWSFDSGTDMCVWSWVQIRTLFCGCHLKWIGNYRRGTTIPPGVKSLDITFIRNDFTVLPFDSFVFPRYH